MTAELNSITEPEELRNALSPWRLELLWDAQGDAARRDAMLKAQEVLRSRSVVAVLQTAVPVPLGVRASLVVPVVDSKVLVHDPEGRMTAALEPDALLAALSEHAGAWCLEEEEQGLVLIAGDDPRLEAAVSELGAARPGVDGFSPESSLAVHYGEPSSVNWGVVLKEMDASVSLHRDVAVITGPDSPERIVTMISDAGTAQLTLRDFGGWVGLAYFSPQAMAAKVGKGELREPTAAFAVGLGAYALPPAPAGGPGGAPNAGQPSTPAERLSTLFLDDFFLPSADDVEELSASMSSVRAEQVVASLASAAEQCPVAQGTLATRPWLGELRDAVEILGFDPRWVGVLAGTESAPEAGEAVAPTTPLKAAVSEAKAEFRAEREAQNERAAAATGPKRLFYSQAWKPSTRYVVAICELIIAAVLVYAQPFPLSWLNLVIAAVLTIDAVWHVWSATKAERAEK